jgi:transposase
MCKKIGNMIDQITVGIDVGCHQHRVAIADPGGHIIEEFDLPHEHLGFVHFFYQLSIHENNYGLPIVIAMEGVNGYARPLDQMILKKGYRLLNVNNLKLCRFREMFPSPAKTDALDAREIIKLVISAPQFGWGKNVLQEVEATPPEHKVLKRLTRRRRQLVEEKVRLLNRMECDIQSVCPGLLELAENKDSQWFLNLLTFKDSLTDIARIRRPTILKIYGIGKVFADKVQDWQKDAHFSEEIDIVGPMIMSDAGRIRELKTIISGLEKKIARLIGTSRLGQLIESIPGFGVTCTGELVAEIGNISRFTSENSLAYYFGMAPLDNSSGKRKGTKTPRNVNTRAKTAMMTAIAHHIRSVPESKIYYNKKRREGKKHNQAVRSLGRHMVRVIWSMIKHDQFYRIKDLENLKDVKKEGNIAMVA